MDRRILLLLVFAAVVLSFTLGYSAGIIQRRITSTGNIVIPPNLKFSVYSDPECTRALTSIDWGSVEAGESASRRAYIKNLGDVPLTLSMAASNWSPSEAGEYMTLTWDGEGVKLPVGGVLEVCFTLSVSSSATGISSFSFDIVLTGSG